MTDSLKDLYPHYYHRIPLGMSHLDVSATLRMFDVTDQTVGHAIKKLLCAGKRGAKDRSKDLREARDSITRALELDEAFGQNTLDSVFGKMPDLKLPDEEDDYDTAGYRGCASVWFGKGTTPEMAARSINRYLDNNAFTRENRFVVKRAPTGTAQLIGRLDFVVFED